MFDAGVLLPHPSFAIEWFQVAFTIQSRSSVDQAAVPARELFLSPLVGSRLSLIVPSPYQTSEKAAV